MTCEAQMLTSKTTYLLTLYILRSTSANEEQAYSKTVKCWPVVLVVFLRTTHIKFTLHVALPRVLSKPFTSSDVSIALTLCVIASKNVASCLV